MPEGLDPLVAAPLPVLVLGAELVLSDPFPTPPALDELPVEPIPVELLPVLLSVLLPVLVSLLLPVPPIVDDPLALLPVLVSLLLPVPLVEVSEEPVPMELGSLVVELELEEPPLP